MTGMAERMVADWPPDTCAVSLMCGVRLLIRCRWGVRISAAERGDSTAAGEHQQQQHRTVVHASALIQDSHTPPC